MFKLAAGIVVGAVGLWAFVYAHDHDPTPEADPMAVHLLGRATYEWMHYGGLALVAIGALLVCWAAYRALRRPPG